MKQFFQEPLHPAFRVAPVEIVHAWVYSESRSDKEVQGQPEIPTHLHENLEKCPQFECVGRVHILASVFTPMFHSYLLSDGSASRKRKISSVEASEARTCRIPSKM